MSPLFRPVLAFAALLGACSSGASTPPPDAGPAGTATPATPAAIPDAAADAAAEAITDAGAGDAASGLAITACCRWRTERRAALEGACHAGKADRCAAAAEDLQHGCGVPTDWDRVDALLTRACALGHEPTCYALSEKEALQDIERDPQEASRKKARLAEATCESTHSVGCRDFAGYLMPYGIRPAGWARRVQKALRQACDGGDGKGCRDLAEKQEELTKEMGIPPPSRREVLDLHVRACKLDREECQWSIARRTSDGPPSGEEAELVALLVSTLLAASEEACAESPCGCTSHQIARWAASTEPERARSFAEKVCAAEGGWRCSALAEFLERGVGGPADLPRAVKLYEVACSGDSLACDGLADMYEQGRGVPKDPSLARRFAEEGCPFEENFTYPGMKPRGARHEISGELGPCTRVARYREEGYGGPVNLKGAYQVYYYYCGTKRGVGLCPKRIALGRKLGMP